MTVPPLRELVHTMLLTVQEADVIRDLRANEVVVVACPPGGRVVVDRTAKPCEHCEGCGSYWIEDDDVEIDPDVSVAPTHCEVCGGSGVVEATTTYGLEAVTWLWSGPECSHIGGGGCRGPHWGQVPHTFRLVAVALPEDGE